MTLKTFLRGQRFQKIVLTVWIITSILIIICQRGIDTIVNSTLYSYGLTFSDNWAQPYWLYQRLVYATQYASLGLTIVALAFSFTRSTKEAKQPPKPEQKADQTAHITDKQTGIAVVISCPSCKKALTKPLVMLDFKGGKARLVNVCPYCDTELGTVGQAVKNKDDSVTVTVAEDTEEVTE